MKTCKQCGISRANEAFRKKYNGEGTYNTCNVCESMNSRWKYLKRKVELSDDEALELKTIEATYDSQRAMGLKPPRRRVKMADKLQNEYNERAKHWLTAELTEEPEYYIGEVYDTLLSADEDIRAAVLKRFYDYEDEYYKEDR